MLVARARPSPADAALGVTGYGLTAFRLSTVTVVAVVAERLGILAGDGKTPPLPRVSTAFAAETAPFLAVRRRGRRCLPQPQQVDDSCGEHAIAFLSLPLAAFYR